MESIRPAFILGLTGALAVLTAAYFGLPTWVLFMAWVSYYLFGTNLKTALLIFIQQFFGILIAMMIQYGGTHLSTSMNTLGFPVIVFFTLIGVFYISKLKYLNTVPAYFLGMIIWFGSDAPIAVDRLFLLLITLLVGYAFAWANTSASLWAAPKNQKSN